MSADIKVRKILQGDKQMLARAISLIENDTRESTRLLEALYPYLGKAYRLGITGPPGVGKSTLTNEFVRLIREKRQTIGIIAIDPTSIFSGGAVLGDRIRMQRIGLDNGVFIRSMATRGCPGGLSRTTSQAADVLDAAGMHYVFIETVGVGQAEVEIFKNVDITILVLSPESGDSIQVMKSGIVEIADIIVVNKADRPEADTMVSHLRSTLDLTHKQIPILKTEANKGTGVAELLDILEKRLNNSQREGSLKENRQKAVLERLKSLVLMRFEEEIRTNNKISLMLEQAVQKISQGSENPYRVVDNIVKTLTRRLNPSRERRE